MIRNQISLSWKSQKKNRKPYFSNGTAALDVTAPKRKRQFDRGSGASKFCEPKGDQAMGKPHEMACSDVDECSVRKPSKKCVFVRIFHGDINGDMSWYAME